MKPKKITLATIKSFVRKNDDKLFINVTSSFDGMIDCVTSIDNGFAKAEKREDTKSHTLGLAGAWFVGGSRDHFTEYEDKIFSGYKVYNCCRSFVLAIRKPELKQPTQELGCYIEDFLNENLSKEVKS